MKNNVVIQIPGYITVENPQKKAEEQLNSTQK